MVGTLNLLEHELPGKFICVCGPDGAGKTTLIETLETEFCSSGDEVVLTFQPSKNIRESELFNRYIYEPKARDSIDYRALVCLLMSDRLQHVQEVIKPNLAIGRTVITDRYIYTALAQFRARGYNDERWFIDLCNLMPRPDAAFVLLPGLQTALARVASRTGNKESYIEFEHDKVLYRNYEILTAEGLYPIDTSGEDPQVAANSILDVLGKLDLLRKENKSGDVA